MPLTLEQYATYLDTRNLAWPARPTIEPVKVRPRLVPLPGIRLVTWNVYGTLLGITSGELYLEHPHKFIMDVALDKTVQEFKMWSSMTRKPGQPAEQLASLYRRALEQQKMAPSPGEPFPEIVVEELWEGVIKKLLQKEYAFDAGFYGSLNEFSRKVAYFFHASLQGTACYPGAAAALAHARQRNLLQGLLADAQCFTLTQLQRGLREQDPRADVAGLIEPDLGVLSFQVGSRKPSERLFRDLVDRAATRDVVPSEILHVGSRIEADIAPARRLGMWTALFAGDRASLKATREQFADAAQRPHVILTELEQIAEIIP